MTLIRLSATACAMAALSPSAHAVAPVSSDVYGVQQHDPILHGGYYLRRSSSSAYQYRKEMMAIRKDLLKAVAATGGVLSATDRTTFQARIDTVEARFRGKDLSYKADDSVSVLAF